MLKETIDTLQEKINKSKELQKNLEKELRAAKNKLRVICKHNWIQQQPLHGVPFERHFFICSICNDSYHPPAG
jgi:hypothetical protein